MKEIKEIYEHIYDKDTDDDGKQKPNKLLGEFEIISGSVNDDYMFKAIGVNVKDNKIYNIVGKEVSGMRDIYNSGTRCFIEEIKMKGYKIIKSK